MTSKSGDSDALEFSYVLASTSEDVRETLTSLRSELENRGYTSCPGDMWELVIAEVLNNIVEHAYDDSPDGKIRLNLRFETAQLYAEIIDQGSAMLNGKLPAGKPANLDVETQHLPEGGFGWNLIQSLSDRLSYERRGTENRLHLEIPIQAQLNC